MPGDGADDEDEEGERAEPSQRLGELELRHLQAPARVGDHVQEPSGQGAPGHVLSAATFQTMNGRILSVRRVGKAAPGISCANVLGEPSVAFVLSREGNLWKISGLDQVWHGCVGVPAAAADSPFLAGNGLDLARFPTRYQAAIALAQALDCTTVSDETAGYAV